MTNNSNVYTTAIDDYKDIMNTWAEWKGIDEDVRNIDPVSRWYKNKSKLAPQLMDKPLQTHSVLLKNGVGLVKEADSDDIFSDIMRKVTKAIGATHLDIQNDYADFLLNAAETAFFNFNDYTDNSIGISPSRMLSVHRYVLRDCHEFFQAASDNKTITQTDSNIVAEEVLLRTIKKVLTIFKWEMRMQESNAIIWSNTLTKDRYMTYSIHNDFPVISFSNEKINEKSVKIQAGSKFSRIFRTLKKPIIQMVESIISKTITTDFFTLSTSENYFYEYDAEEQSKLKKYYAWRKSMYQTFTKEQLNELYDKIVDIIQIQLSIEREKYTTSDGYMHLSVNIKDFLLASVNTSWTSCYNLYDGGYNGGIVQLMEDYHTIVAFGTKEKLEDSYRDDISRGIANITWNDKLWRVYAHVHQNRKMVVMPPVYKREIKSIKNSVLEEMLKLDIVDGELSDYIILERRNDVAIEVETGDNISCSSTIRGKIFNAVDYDGDFGGYHDVMEQSESSYFIHKSLLEDDAFVADMYIGDGSAYECMICGHEDIDSYDCDSRLPLCHSHVYAYYSDDDDDY